MFVAAVAVVAGWPSTAGATPAPRLAAGANEALLLATNADPWFLDDGCTGGSTPRDPLVVTPAAPESSCTVRVGVPVVVLAAGLTCFLDTVEAVRDECEAGWADPEHVLVSAVAEVDGRPVALVEHRVGGSVTFPEDSALGAVAGAVSPWYAISRTAVVRGLRPGVHVVHASFSYADGFTGDTTFTITVIR